MSNYISPEARNYPGLDRGFNQRFKLDSNLTKNSGEGIYLVTDADDIVDTLENLKQYSPQSGEIKCISGGHCYENFVFQSAADTSTGTRTRFIIDLSNMRHIGEETINDTEYVFVEPGASNWLIQQTLHSLYGAALPGGSCYSVCAGGHISGGGYGLLSRLHGLTVDYLEGVEMVIPDNATGGYKVRSFNPESDSDGLNWASKGSGGGNFGIVTKYYFRKSKVPPSPEHALFVSLPVPWKQFAGAEGSGAKGFSEFMQAYYTACNNMPGQAFCLGKFTCMANEEDSMIISMQVVYGTNSGHSSALGGVEIAPLATKSAALEVISQFRASLEPWIAKPNRRKSITLVGHPVSATVDLHTVYDLPWIDMTQLLNGSGENQNGKYKSSYMIENFTPNEAEEIYAFLTDTQPDNPAPAGADKTQTLIQIDSYGLQINEMDNQSELKTAVAARQSVLKTQYQTYWKIYEDTSASDAKQIEQEIVSWFNAGYNAIHRKAQDNKSGFPLWGEKYQGCYINYPDKQLGVNQGYTSDPGEQYGDFLELYFGNTVRDRLIQIKKDIDPENRFSFSQSVTYASQDK